MATLTTPGLGMNSWFGFGEENVYGTGVTPTNWLEIENESLAKEVQRIEAKSILRRGIVDNKVVPGAISVMGDVSFPVQYDGWYKLLKHAFGEVTDSQPDVTNAPTAYNHRFKITDVLPTGLTVEVFRDSTQFTTEPNKSFVYTGCKIDKVTFEAAVDQVMKVSMGFMGQNEARASRSAANPSFSNANYAIFTQGTVYWNGNDIEADKFSITLNNGLGARYKLGSALTRQPVPENKIAASGSFEAEFTGWAEYDDFVAATKREMIFDSLGSTIAGSIKERIKMTCSQTDIDKTHIILDKPGRLKLGIDFKCYRNTAQTQNEIVIDVVNTSATV